jgi:hypothetical protein
VLSNLKSLSRAETGLLLLLMLAGAWLRLHGIGEWYWSPDDSYRLFHAGAPTLWQVIERVTAHDTHAPLIYIILHFMLMLGDHPLWLRSVSYVPGVLAIPAAFLLGRAVIGKEAGWVIAVLATFSSDAIILSQPLRQYSLLLLIQIIVLWHWWNFHTTSQRKPLFWMVCWLLIGLLTHYMIALLALALALAEGMRRIYRKQWSQFRDLFVAMSLFGVFAGLFLAGYFSLQLNAYYMLEDARMNWASYGFPRENLLAHYLEQLFYIMVAALPYDAVSAVIGLIALYVGVFYCLREGRQKTLLGIFSFLLTFYVIGSFFGKMPFMAGRHVVCLLVFFWLLTGCGLQIAIHRLAREMTKRPVIHAAKNFHPPLLFAPLVIIYAGYLSLAYPDYRKDYFLDFTIKAKDFARFSEKVEGFLTRPNHCVVMDLCSAQLFLARQGDYDSPVFTAPQQSYAKDRGIAVSRNYHQGSLYFHHSGRCGITSLYKLQTVLEKIPSGCKVMMATTSWKGSNMLYALYNQQFFLQREKKKKFYGQDTVNIAHMIRTYQLSKNDLEAILYEGKSTPYQQSVVYLPSSELLRRLKEISP